MNLWFGIGVDLWLNVYDGKILFNVFYDWMFYDLQ